MGILRKPSIKQRKFAKLLVATGSKVKAYSGAYEVGSHGGKGKNLHHQADIILKHPFVQELVRQELDKVGLKESKISRKLNDIVDAGTTVNKLKFTTPALALDAIKEVNKMKGNYPAEKKQIDKRTTRLSMDLKGKSMEELTEQLNSLREQMRNFKSLMDKGRIRKEESNVEIL